MASKIHQENRGGFIIVEGAPVSKKAITGNGLARGGFSEKESIGSSRVKISVNWLRSGIKNHTRLQEELLMGHPSSRENTDCNLYLKN